MIMLDCPKVDLYFLPTFVLVNLKEASYCKPPNDILSLMPTILVLLFSPAVGMSVNLDRDYDRDDIYDQD